MFASRFAYPGGVPPSSYGLRGLGGGLGYNAISQMYPYDGLGYVGHPPPVPYAVGGAPYTNSALYAPLPASRYLTGLPPYTLGRGYGGYGYGGYPRLLPPAYSGYSALSRPLPPSYPGLGLTSSLYSREVGPYTGSLSVPLAGLGRGADGGYDSDRNVPDSIRGLDLAVRPLNRTQVPETGQLSTEVSVSLESKRGEARIAEKQAQLVKLTPQQREEAREEAERLKKQLAVETANLERHAIAEQRKDEALEEAEEMKLSVDSRRELAKKYVQDRLAGGSRPNPVYPPGFGQRLPLGYGRPPSRSKVPAPLELGAAARLSQRRASLTSAPLERKSEARADSRNATVGFPPLSRTLERPRRFGGATRRAL